MTPETQKEIQERLGRLLAESPLAEEIKEAVSFARENGVPTVNAFFSAEVAAQIVAEQGKANVLIGNNVLAHIHDLHAVAAAATRSTRRPSPTAFLLRVSLSMWR